MSGCLLPVHVKSHSHQCRKDLLALLAARRETLDVKSLLQALQKTVTFEKHLAARFAAAPPADGKSKACVRIKPVVSL